MNHEEALAFAKLMVSSQAFTNDARRFAQAYIYLAALNQASEQTFTDIALATRDMPDPIRQMAKRALKRIKDHAAAR